MKKLAIFIVLFAALLLLQGATAANAPAVKPTAVAKPTTAVKKAPVKVKDWGKNGIKKIALDFISQYLVPDSVKTEVTVGGKVDGLYQLEIKLNGNKQTAKAAISPDGSRFYPQVMEVEKVKKEAAAAATNNVTPASGAVINAKSERPQVELFVMSHCPYGTQMEKGLIPVLEALGNKIDWQIKFVDYAMHGKKEVDEQLNQHCIQKEQNSKYLSYLKCFLTDGDSAACLTQTGIDQETLTACLAATDSQYQISAGYNNQSSWQGSFPPFNIYQLENNKYGVQGSPTLVINGQTVSGNRDSASLLATVCSAFTTPPAACSFSLSKQTPAPGFGSGTTTNATPASCL